ncbi:hypothetical protein K490DRAFT_56258 [Saccharata proteae CBS 121410]|uniref:Uncharacterized protein n=1 Tax=Saccharata proteae CBS 121410 TaxID=1314787 RepID=A0A9P4HY81_9PEZI|nr:hypothetical protein K490DRAFT_56258 [Saccharata proteae CBS 121410]
MAASPPPQQQPRRTFNTKPSIDTSTPAINAQPVEMDGTPTTTSPHEVRERMGSWDIGGSSSGGSHGGIGASGGGGAGGMSAASALAEEEDALEEFGLVGRQRGRSEARAQLLSSRKSDPAVLVDIPQGPSVEELELAAKAEAANVEGGAGGGREIAVGR